MREIETLKRMEALAESKAAVYGRVLTDVSLANEMQDLAKFHGGRTQSLADLLGMDGEADDEA